MTAQPFTLSPLSEAQFTSEYHPRMRPDGNYFQANDLTGFPNQYVWTVVDDDKGGLVARPGRHPYDAPVGYLKTSYPWQMLAERAIWSDPVDEKPNGFKSNITFEPSRYRKSPAVAAVGPYSKVNGSKPSGFEIDSLKAELDGAYRRVTAIEENGQGVDEHVSWLEGRLDNAEANNVSLASRISDLEALVRLLTLNLDGTMANVGGLVENMKSVARIFEQD